MSNASARRRPIAELLQCLVQPSPPPASRPATAAAAAIRSSRHHHHQQQLYRPAPLVRPQEAPQSPLAPPPPRPLLRPQHLGRPPRAAPVLWRRLRRPPGRVQPGPPLHLPLVPPAEPPRPQHRLVAAAALWQGPLGPRLCGLLHRRPVLLARVPDAGAAHPARPPQRHQEQRQAAALRRANVHGHLLQHHGPGGRLRHEPEPRVVLSHDGHVRGVPAPLARGLLQVLLPVPGGVLGAAGHRDAAGL
ncbi:hypothetical protein MKX07_000392 [Trichoderma sp. CBMAI-0711]|nr:hypothetical protein MKX07_000392 [Trichoderma sp. CBMAI-0711]